jgi:hypothetical protein
MDLLASPKNFKRLEVPLFSTGLFSLPIFNFRLPIRDA